MAALVRFPLTCVWDLTLPWFLSKKPLNQGWCSDSIGLHMVFVGWEKCWGSVLRINSWQYLGCIYSALLSHIRSYLSCSPCGTLEIQGHINWLLQWLELHYPWIWFYFWRVKRTSQIIYYRKESLVFTGVGLICHSFLFLGWVEERRWTAVYSGLSQGYIEHLSKFTTSVNISHHCPTPHLLSTFIY